MAIPRASLMTLFAPAVLALGIGGAAADAIDGDWCKAGAQFSINGPRIVTPAGIETRGDYDRHGFFYLDADGGFAQGAEIRMRLLNDENVRIFVGTADSEGEVWQRCDFVS